MKPSASLPWVLLLAVVVLWPLWPLLAGGGFVVQHDVWVSDPLHANLPYRIFLGQSLRQGHLPMWMPGAWSGSPFLAQIEAGALYPPHLLLYGLLDPYTATNLALSLDTVVAAAGAWLLARRLGVSAAGAALAGLVFAWSGFMVSHLRHFNMHAAAAWLPWILLATEDLLDSRGRKGGPRLAALLALQLAAGHPQISYYTGLVVAVRTLVGLAARPGQRLRSGAAIAAATALSGGLLAVQLLPVAAFTGASYLQVEPSFAFATAFPFTPADLWVFLDPGRVGSMETYDYAQADGIPWGNYGYMGLLPLLLAVVGTVRGGRRAWWLAGGAGLCLVLVLGQHTPLFELVWTWLPGMDLFRFPNRFLFVLALAVGLLAGVGLDALGRWLPSRAMAVLGVAVLALTLADLQRHHGPRMPIDDAAAWRDEGPLPDLLARAGVTGRLTVLEEFDLWERAFHEAQGTVRGLEPYRKAWRIPIGHSGIRMGLETTSGYTRMAHSRPAAFWQRYNHSTLAAVHQPREPSLEDPTVDPARWSLWVRGGVEVVLAAIPIEDPRLRLVALDPLGVYLNPSALPRAYHVTRWEPVADLDAAARWMLEEGVDQPRVPAIEGAGPAPGPGGIALLALSSPDSDTRVVDLPTGAPAGHVVVIESWDEGWTATVDGQPATVRVANGYQVAVEVPTGARQVVLRYRPPGLQAGLLVSLGSLVALLGWRRREWAAQAR